MTSQRILVVDDDPLIRRQLEDLFRQRGYQVDAAGDAPEALQFLEANDYVLAVVDLRIPGTDGLSLTRQIHERWSDLGVIIITGYASIRGAVEAIRQGAKAYVTKPVDGAELLKKIAALG